MILSVALPHCGANNRQGMFIIDKYMITGYFDGSCEPVNPGGVSRYGYVIERDGRVIQFGTGVEHYGGALSTNNVAEYAGLLNLLLALKEHGLRNAQIYGDSNLVVNTVMGHWGRKSVHKKAPHLKPYALQCRGLVKEVAAAITWIPREQNQMADFLSKSSLG